MVESDNSVVDPSILFGGAALAPVNKPDTTDDGGIPAFLRRQGEEVQVSTPEPEQPQPVFTTAVDQQGQTEVVIEEVQRDAAQGDHTEALAAHSQPQETVPEHTPVGHNNPPEDPLTREEMLRDMWKDIGAYGKDSGKGAAALPRLGMRVIRAAADGLISNEKPKDGSKSDAVRIYEKYAEQDSKHAEHSKGGMKANAAKLNALIGLGCMTTVDGVDVADRAVRLREKMEGEDQKPKALFAGLVDVARAQMEQDQPLTDDAIMAALGKTVKDKTLAEEWAAIYKKVEKIVSGENPHGIKDQSDRALKIAEQINEHINNFAVDAEQEDQIAFCMERGMTREQAKAFVANK